ncbi:46 kDa FK506-binding nuclear protein [Eufriesea mexicana]|nr:46 kDa FK506-binding nuclear protein [Eufriesea mexicana]
MASLNLQTSDDNVVQVMLYYEDSSYLLCNLKKSSTWQVPLDLNFQEGTTIAFICHGHGQVHLTGYLIPEDLDLDELEEEEDDEESPQLVDKQSKRKAIDSLKNEKNVKRPKQEIEPESSDEDIELDVEGGVQIEEIKVGNGPFAKSGKFVSVYYVGRLKNGKKFDSTTQGDGFKFRLGREEVIKGWDIGIVGMKVGGKRRIIIPPAMAYGAKGSPPVIPGNSTLVFEVELRNVH